MSTQTARLIIALNEQVANRGLIKRALDEIHAASNRPMGRGLVNLGRQMETEAKRIQAAASRIAGSLAPAAFGVGALIAKTQEYEKAFYGVKVSMIADNMEEQIDGNAKRNVINLGNIQKAAGKAKVEVEDLSKALMMRPAALMKAWEAVGKAGVPYSLDGLSPQDREARLLKSQRTLVEMGAEVHRQDTDMPIDKAAEFLHTLGINYKAGDAKFERGTGKGDYDADVAKLANQLLYVANATKTSASKLSAGLRQYAPLYGNLGNSFSESAALLGAMVQGGLDEVEAGTALKSMGVRFIKNFTSEGRDAWLAAGLRRSDYTTETAVSGKKAASTLGAMTDKKLSKQQSAALREFFLKAEKAGKMNDPAFVMDAARFYNKLTGARDQATRDRNMDRVRAAMFSAGNEIDMFKLFRALSLKMGGMNEADRDKSLDAWGMGDLGTLAQTEVKKRLEKGTLTQNQLSVIGEGRHLSRYNALLALFGTAEELERRARGLNNKEITTAGRDLAKDDQFWKWEEAMGRLEQAFNRLRESDAITGLITKLAELATSLADADPKMVEFVGQMIALSFVLAPLSAALSGIVGSFLILAGGIGMLKRLLLGAPVAAGAAAAGGAATGAGAAGAAAAGGTAAAIARRQAILRRLRFGGMIGAGVIAGQAVGERVGLGGGDGKGGTEVGGMVAGGATGYGVYRYLNWRAAKTAAKAAGGSARFIPGLGWIVTAGAGAYGAYEGYKKDGTLMGAAKGAFHGITFGLFDTPEAKAQPPASTIVSAGNQVVAAGAAGVQAAPAALKTEAQSVPPAVGQAMGQARAIVQQTVAEMQSMGAEMMANLAAGIRAGAPAVGAAVNDAMSSQVRGAVRGSFTDGGYR